MNKQQLSERNTYTPTSAPQAGGNCDLGSKQSCEVGTVVQDLKTSDNNPDEELTPAEQGGQGLRVPAVYVQNMQGEPLMPTKASKARKLLNKEEAYVIKRTPFTIRLKKQTGEAKQDITLGVDTGYKTIGLSATTNKKEVFSAEIQLRTDISKLLSDRKQFRRSRRHRKTWYRKPRFHNRKKQQGWLAPSVRHKLSSHVKLVKEVSKLLPIFQVNVETAKFDIHKIKNPRVEGKGYQQGEQLNFYNVREYVLYRDKHKCQNCKGKSKDKVLQVHHIESRKTSGDTPENLVTLCKTCHRKYHLGDIDLNVKKSKSFQSETITNIVNSKILNELRYLGFSVHETYGYITKYNRINQRLKKSHINDAFVIAGGTNQIRSQSYTAKQIRKQNRKLYKGIRSHIRNQASRFVYGFQRFDKVLYNDIECFIFGRRSSGYFDIRKLSGEKISSTAKSSELKLLEKFQTLLMEVAIPPLSQG